MGNCPLKADARDELPKRGGQVAITMHVVVAKPPTSEVTAVEVSRSIDRQIAADGERNGKTMTLLFLGPSESGKSTVLKQLKIINKSGYTKGELLAQRTVVYQNVIQSVCQLITGVRKLGMELPSSLETHVFNILTLKHATPEAFDDHILDAIKAIWSLDVVQKAYERRSEFQLLDCAKYFLDEMDRLQCFDYCPTTEDMLNARVITVGVNELTYSYNDMDFRIIDVGGQRSERRKWINFFDNVNAIFFIAAISEFDQRMFEDDETHRLLDAIRLFNEVGNNPIFEHAPLILFLNKRDLFEEKLKLVRLERYFKKYRYKNDAKNGTKYIAKKFQKQIVDKSKAIYTHLTCAKDTRQIEVLTNSLSDMIIIASLKRMGTN